MSWRRMLIGNVVLLAALSPLLGLSALDAYRAHEVQLRVEEDLGVWPRRFDVLLHEVNPKRLHEVTGGEVLPIDEVMERMGRKVHEHARRLEAYPELTPAEVAALP